MLTILYFAKTRDDLSCDKESIEWVPELSTIAELKALLCTRGEIWNSAIGNSLCAINHKMAQDNQPITDGDEIAFFPPVTGG